MCHCLPEWSGCGNCWAQRVYLEGLTLFGKLVLPVCQEERCTKIRTKNQVGKCHTPPTEAHSESSEETNQLNLDNQNQRRIRNGVCFYISNLYSWQNCFLWRMTDRLCTPLHVPLSSLLCSPCSHTVLLHNPLSPLENTFSFGVPSNSYAIPEYPSIINASLAHKKRHYSIYRRLNVPHWTQDIKLSPQRGLF